MAVPLRRPDTLRHRKRAPRPGAIQFGNIAFGQAITGRRIQRRPTGRKAFRSPRHGGKSTRGEQFLKLKNPGAGRHARQGTG